MRPPKAGSAGHFSPSVRPPVWPSPRARPCIDGGEDEGAIALALWTPIGQPLLILPARREAAGGSLDFGNNQIRHEKRPLKLRLMIERSAGLDGAIHAAPRGALGCHTGGQMWFGPPRTCEGCKRMLTAMQVCIASHNVFFSVFSGLYRYFAVPPGKYWRERRGSNPRPTA